MQIPWTNCAEQMPPDDEEIILIAYLGDLAGYVKTNAAAINNIEYKYDIPSSETKWTEFTPEKWDELNK